MGQGFVELQKIGEPERVAFGPNSNRVLFSDGEQTLRVWDTATKKYLPASWQGHMAAISPDGKLIVTAAQQATRVFSTAGAVQLELATQTGRTLNAVYSSDGKEVATAESDNFVRIRDAATGKVLQEQPFQMDNIASLRFSLGNSDFLLMTSINNAKVWDWRSQQPPIELPELIAESTFLEELGGGEFSPDGKLIVGPSGRFVSLWDARSGCRLKVQFPHQSGVHGVVFSRDGRFILSSDSYAVKLWEIPAGLQCEGDEVTVKETVSLGHSETGAFAKRNALLSPDGQFIIVTSFSGEPAQVYNSSTKNLRFRLGDASSTTTRDVAMNSTAA
jgi:WD40 repeat protein